MRNLTLCGLLTLVALACAITTRPAAAQSPTTLADQPIFSTVNVPGNMALTLSVEYPTANSVANLNPYASATTYLGYFDPAKCYDYVYSAIYGYYFKPAAFATSHACSGHWSGNFMNWAATQTIDPFRWALTGGYRAVDVVGQTIIEKAWQTGQGGVGNYPDRGTSTSAISSNNLIPSTVSVSSITPFSWTTFNSRIAGNGNVMVFSSDASTYQTGSNQNGNPQSVPDLTTTSPSTGKAYQVYIRVDVCDPSTTLGVLGLETNCVQYGALGVNYKPEGLLQQYSSKIKFSVFGYPDGDGATYQGGLLREPMGFIGPTYPQPLSPTLITNTRPEWSSVTGIQSGNPDPTTALGSGVTNSGVINYINKFGETTHNYMQDDDVSILYYAAVRYFENLGNVSAWTSPLTSTQLDGFPAVTTWVDPISYSCQKNFVLGIGDDHTHLDYNVGGGTATGSIPKPSAVAADSFNQTETWLKNLETLEGMAYSDYITSPALSPGACCDGATYYIAGLAYGTHVNDIRPDLGTKDPTTGKKISAISTISTYWMDVEEYQVAENLNQYYLATKYGGFAVPTGYSTSNTTTPLTLGWWDTTGNPQIYMNGTYQNPPDNYYLAGNASLMVAGLSSAFKNISNAISAFTTSFSLASPSVTSSGATSFAAQYSSTNWTGTVSASTLTISGTTDSLTPLWSSNTTLQSQLTGSGWDTGRNVATWNGLTGVAFRAGNLSLAQTLAIIPTYSILTTATQYVNYLRGDQTNEVASTATGSTHSLRSRTLFLGDIVDSQLTAVSAPAMSYAETYNPGYATFKSTYANRPTTVYFGANDGMLHAFDGTSGSERFAYVPYGLFVGPTATPQTNGLVELGSPNYVHHFYVDATPVVVDVDVSNAGTGWKSILVGGLGKGGQSYYAIDVSNPAGMTTEAAVAGKVLWEFNNLTLGVGGTLGYSYGAPNAVKTAKYGWVILVTSGYDNSDGYGYLYLVNPANGALYEKIRTPLPSNGLTQASAYVQDYTNYTADSVYVGDLNGQLWRFDLTEAKGNVAAYPLPTLLALATDASNNPEPITSAPLIEIYPTTRKRYVMFGTGQLLSSNDVGSSQQETFYAIMDGTAGSGAFNTVTTPYTRSNLTPVSSVLTGVTVPPTSVGWYFDLGAAASIGWRDIANPVAYNGVVAFTALLTSANPCSPGGTSEIFAVNYSTGKSVLLNNSTGFVTTANAVTNLKLVDGPPAVPGGQQVPEFFAGDSGGNVAPIQANLTGTIATRILNWREVPTSN